MSIKTDNFISKIASFAVNDMKETKVLASLTIAQAILESGWGRSELALKANNLFGIKATSSWDGKTYTRQSTEWKNGEQCVVSSTFKAYDDWDGSISDHSILLQSKRYSKVLETTDYKVACEEVYKAGYASDPNYPSKLIELIEMYDLYQFDKLDEPELEVELEPELEVEKESALFYRVVVGSYSNRENAESKQKSLQSKGFDSFLDSFNKDGVDLLRVVSGSYKDKENALKQQEKLKADGFNSFLVAESV